MRIKPLCSALAAGVLALSLAACGDSDSESAADPDAPGGAKTIGIWEPANTGEGVNETRDALIDALDAVGWKHTLVDGNNIPATMASTMQSLVNDDVDAIIAIYLNTGAVAPQLAAAKEAGIPVLSVGFTSTANDNVTGLYAPDESVQADLLIERMAEDLPDGGTVAPIAIAGYEGVDKEMASLEEQADANNFDLLERIDISIPTLFADAPKATTAVLNANPDLGAIYMGIDVYTQLMSPAVEDLGRDTPLYGFGAISTALPFLEKGNVTLVTSDNARSGYVAVDALLDYFVNETPIPATTTEENAFQYKIIDETNIPTGEFTFPADTYAPDFLSRWKTEYGIDG